MGKYRIELSEQQMRLIAYCLEDVSRFASGQWEMSRMLNFCIMCLPTFAKPVLCVVNIIKINLFCQK